MERSIKALVCVLTLMIGLISCKRAGEDHSQDAVEPGLLSEGQDGGVQRNSTAPQEVAKPDGPAVESDSPKDVSVPSSDSTASERAKADGPPEDAAAETVIEWYFKKEIAVQKKRLSEEMAKVDKSRYQAFLEGQRTAAQQRCDLTSDLTGLIAEYEAAEESEKQVAVLSKIRKSAIGLEDSQRKCVAALTTKVNESGIFLSGLLYEKGKAGSDLKPNVASSGWIYLLLPQIVTAWPGRPDSALRILDPTEGPWKVLVASSFQEKVETFSRAWALRDRIGFSEFLAARKNDDHFLVVDEDGAAVGWISANDCAFYHDLWESSMRRSKEVFTKGIAFMLQGIHYYPEARCDSRGHCPPIRIFDFITMTQGRLLSGRNSSEISLTRIREFHIKNDLLPSQEYISCILEQNGDSSKTTWNGLEFYELPVSLSAPRRADASLMHVEMTKVPLERLMSLW